MRNRASGGSSFISVWPVGLRSLVSVGFAGLVVEQVDFGARIVHDDQVVQAVAIEIGDVQLADLVVDGKNFGTGEAEGVYVG